MSPRKIVVTGVAGFIGSNLADRLCRSGFHVVGIDNLAYGVREQVPDGVEFHLADIRDPAIEEHLKGADAIFHLAAKNCIADCQDDPVETADINVRGTVNVCQAAMRAGCDRIVYAESSAMYEGVDRLPTPEETIAPQSFYAVSKAAAAGFVEGYVRYHGIRVTGLRYFCVYGPRQDYRRTIPPVMSAFIIKILTGDTPTIFGNGSKKRDFVHVDDVNDFHIMCLDDPRTVGGVFNVGSGENHSVLEIYRRIAGLLGAGSEPDFKRDLPGEAQETLADITAARRLGWRPKIGLDAGLRTSIDYIRAHVVAGS